MTWTTTASAARIGARLRFGLLVLVAMLVGHDAVYAAEHGFGSAFRTAMTTLGHDGWWIAFTIVASIAAAGLALGSAVTIVRLHRRADRPSTGLSRRASIARYAREFRSIWPRLFVVVIVLFMIQENIETLLAHDVLPGVDVLFAGSLPLALPVLALTTLAVAAIGALVRWRIAALRARSLGFGRAPRRIVASSRPSREWAAIDAAAPHRWIPDRPDAGRAPPMAGPA